MLLLLSLSLPSASVPVSACDDDSPPFRPTYPPRATLDDDGFLCQTCQAFMEVAYQSSQNATTMADLLTVLKGACASLGGLDTLACDLAVTEIVKVMPGLPAKLYSAGIYTPQILCSALGACSVNCCKDNSPSQVHLAAAAVGARAGTAMLVTWMTADNTTGAGSVRYGQSAGALTQSADAALSTYTNGGWVGAIHIATMDALTPDVEYYYQVGSDAGGWSPVRSFTPYGPSLPAGFRFAVVGDMGAERTYSAGHQDYINFASSAKAPPEVKIETVIHAGDIGYADGYMERWDELFNAMEPTAATMPYMVCPGNHEAVDQFTSYNRRLPMPAAASNATATDARYYSWDAGCVHFVSLSSESVLNGPEIDDAQIEWLKADLAAFAPRRAAAMAQRAAEPWGPAATQCTLSAPSFLIVYMHRPMYCSTGGKQGAQRCGQQAPYLRGLVEDIFVQFGVDLVYSGHVHAYERTAPVVNGTADARGPVYLMNGSGGNREGETNTWNPDTPSYSLVRQGRYGMGALTVLNATALDWQWFFQTDLADAAADFSIPKPTDHVVFRARTQ